MSVKFSFKCGPDKFFFRLNCSSNFSASTGITAALQRETYDKFDLSIFEML
jgi:hypothetical protein